MMDSALRAKVETAIDRLISALDAIDSADDDREPSLGWLADGQLAYGLGDDREEQCEDEGAQCDGGGGDEAYDNGIGDADGLMEQTGTGQGIGSTGFARYIE